MKAMVLIGACAAAALPLRPQPGAEPVAAVNATLDALHQAAADADGDRYFALFAPDAVFLGTDASERWTLDEFRAWARERDLLNGERGWTYRARDRHTRVAGDTAWFDERLDNDSLGECRGTGVLVRTAEGWRIAQYNLTVPIPNDLMGEVAGMIRRRAQDR